MRKTLFTGHPVREEIRELADSNDSTSAPRHLLVTGGSQGARALDMALADCASLIRERGVSVWHQCRSENVEEVTRSYSVAGVEARVNPFIQNMAEAYRWAHIIVSRSGAGSVMELGVVNRPAILVPYPHAQGNHQLANAMVLVDAGKAILVEEGEGFDSRLREALIKLMDPEIYGEIKHRPFDGRMLDAADRIASGVLALATDRQI